MSADISAQAVSRLVLADLGGTHLRCAFWTPAGPGPVTTLKVAEYEGLAPALRAFAIANGAGSMADCHVALSCGMHPREGVVAFDRTHKKNGWTFNLATIAGEAGVARLEWVHDFHAMALAVRSDVAGVFRPFGPVLPQAKAAGKPAVVLGAGTGLGHGYIWPQTGMVQETHGGHFPACAVTERQRAVLAHLSADPARTRPVIFEALLCGEGIWCLYTALCAITGQPRLHDNTGDLVQAGRADPMVADTLALYAEWLGLYAHVTASCVGAYGGVYLTGGVIERLDAAGMLDEAAYLSGFNTPMVQIVSESLASTPHHMVGRPHTALYGLSVWVKQQGWVL